MLSFLHSIAANEVYLYSVPVACLRTVFCTVFSLVRDMSKDHMHVAGARIRIQQLSEGPNIWSLSLKNAQCPIKLYAIKKLGEEFLLTVPVSIVDRGSPFPLTIDRILMEVVGKWQSFEDWVLEWALPDRHLRSPHHAYQAQRKGWVQER